MSPPAAIRAALLAALAVAFPRPGDAGTPPLVAAARSGDTEAAVALLRERQADANDAEADGTTALHWAARHDDAALAERLVAAGADPAARNQYGVSPLFLAAENGSAEMIALLLDAGADPNEVGNEGETVLMTAARTGAVDAARRLLERGADVDAREAWHGQTALMWAAAQGHPETIRLLVEHGADVDARSNHEVWARQTTAEPRAKWLPPGAMTPLLFAAREGCVECIPVLADLGADLDATTPDGIGPLLSALINGHYDAAAALIEAGADVGIVDETGRGALYAAIDFSTMPASNRPAPYVLGNRLSALDVAAMLLERGADPNARLASMPPYRAKLDRGNDMMLNAGTTPLLRAAKAGDVEAIRLLLAHGADPMLTNRDGIDPLMAAAGLGSAEQDTTGRYKTEAQAIESIRLLIEAGLDVNAADRRGRTAVHGAALWGFDEVIRFLAEQGARLDVADSNGHTPADTALGLAGGFGFTGREGVVREGTAVLIRELIAERQDAPR